VNKKLPDKLYQEKNQINFKKLCEYAPFSLQQGRQSAIVFAKASII